MASPEHPLAGGSHPPGAARGHIQLVLTDRSPLTQGHEFAVVGNHTWRLADLVAKHMLLKEGIGWGNMPEPMVRDDIEAGRWCSLIFRIAKAALIASRPSIAPTRLSRRPLPDRPLPEPGC
ncbi:hypothetical protein [Sinorhizobium meliloti]|uniref:hypothetical protein n=1 Tax=Rhizobium meliloti TaxID=382 RepID=UPI002D795781|nr:hypothetical protein [Sinorhizobium meliloti]